MAYEMVIPFQFDGEFYPSNSGLVFYRDEDGVWQRFALLPEAFQEYLADITTGHIR